MDEKRKRSDETNLDLCLKTPTQDEPINKVQTLEEAMNFELKHGHVDPNVDLKKLRRIMSNRLSAQRSRIRKIEYTAELEKKVKELEDTIAWAGSEIENVKDNKKKLMLENEMLQAQLDIVTDKSNLRIAQTQELKLELKELAKTQGIEGQSSNFYESESIAEIDMDQYLNFDAMNFYPPRIDDL
ncbi:transcription factor VIP1-like [Solanum tuberosum]|uniref:Transcription factor PosF21 n=1 Tax=Solanum tuberosum TaxID=4113 RepID=M1CZC9_SOLTU|nr:PREDICTED: transcription factor VIP1-like [Solanum tuberosum]